MSKFFSVVAGLLLFANMAWPQAIDQRKAGMYVATEAGATCTQATLELADDAALALGYVLMIPPLDRAGVACQWPITSNLTIDSPLYVPPATSPPLTVSAGVTLTLAKCPLIGQYQAWVANGTTSGTVSIDATGTCPVFPSSWAGGDPASLPIYQLMQGEIVYLSVDAGGAVTPGGVPPDESVTLPKIHSSALEVGTTGNLVTYDNIQNVVPPTVIDAISDMIDCGTWGPSLATVQPTADFTLASDPQISGGGVNHLCTIWNDSAFTLTLVNGAGLSNHPALSVVLSPGMAVQYRYNAGTSMWHHLGKMGDTCHQTTVGGVLTWNCASITTITQIIDEEFIPVGWCQDGTAPPATITNHGQVAYRDFDATSGEDIRCSWRVPRDWFDGASGAVKVQAVYLITNATGPVAGEGASWGIAGCSSGVGDTVDCGAGTEVNSETADLDVHTQWDVVEDAFVEVTVTNIAAGEWVRFNINRDVADAEDDYAQDVGLVGFTVKFYRQPGTIVY